MEDTPAEDLPPAGGCSIRVGLEPAKQTASDPSHLLGSFGKRGVFLEKGERGLLERLRFLEISENLENVEILKSPRVWKTKKHPTTF